MGFLLYELDKNDETFLINCTGCIVKLALGTIIKPSNLKRFVETFRAPIKSKEAEDRINLPLGELLFSISVKPNYQASGIGSQLVKVLEEY